MSSKIITDLKSVPNIVGALGLNIAAAQKALNADYVQNLDRIVGIAKDLLGKTDGAQGGAPSTPEPTAELLKSIVAQLAPVRYVFTETTLNVRLDLAQSLDAGGDLSVGGGVGAVMVNAGFSLAFAQEYRGSAECKTVIHVDPRSTAASDALINRATILNAVSLSLTDSPKVDKEIYEGLKQIREKVKA